jgi:hypothetical protein
MLRVPMLRVWANKCGTRAEIVKVTCTSKICEHGVDGYFKRKYLKQQETNVCYCNSEILPQIGPSALLHWEKVVAI